MAKESAIGWTDGSWNPWRGCHKVSAGCKNCYMFRDQKRYGNDPDTVVRAAPATFNAPMKWKEPMKVFTCSWSDFFIEEADEWRDEAWAIIKATPWITYQVLTKRPERILQCLPEDWGEGYPNVWLIFSAENQIQYDMRAEQMRNVKAALIGVSAEPLLGRIHLQLDRYPFLGWAIVGGESGPEKDIRRMSQFWARTIRDEAEEGGIPLFYKQRGGSTRIGGIWGGNLLDGVKHEAFPV